MCARSRGCWSTAAARPTTPVAAVRWGTRPEQHTVRGTLATIADLGIEPPSAIVVGDVAALDLGWFEQRPLFGRRIVVTRAREQASTLRTRLEELGAEVIELPSIAIEPVDFELPPLGQYGWLVFTSANGVEAFFERGLAPPASTPARWVVRASPRSDPARATRSRATASASTSCPSASSPSRCWPRSPTPSRTASRC